MEIDSRTHELFDNKLQNASQRLHSKDSLAIARDYLLDTFRELGLEYDVKDQDHPITLREGFSFHCLNKFYPQFFECSLEKLHLVCQGLSNSKFEILYDILLNVQKLSDLKINFESISIEKAELLSNLILKSKSLQRLTVKMPDLNAFKTFAEMTFPVKKFSNIEIHSNKTETSIGFQQSLTDPNETLQECNLKFAGLNQGFHEATQIILPYLKTFRSINVLRLSLGKNINYRNFLSQLLEILESLKSLCELDLGFANVSLLTDLTSPISRVISTSSCLTKVSLFLNGKELSNQNLFDGLFPSHNGSPPTDHPLKEFSLTLMGCNQINFKQIRDYLQGFSQLKEFDLKLYKAGPPMEQLKSLVLFHLPAVSWDLAIRDSESNREHEIAKGAVEGFFKYAIPAFRLRSFVVEKLMSHHIPDYVDF